MALCKGCMILHSPHNCPNKKMKITKEQIEEIILWARQWAEYVDDEDVLKYWYDKVNLNHDYGDRRWDLTEFAQIIWKTKEIQVKKK